MSGFNKQITFETQKEFDDAVMDVLYSRLGIILQKKYSDPYSNNCELNIILRDDLTRSLIDEDSVNL